MQSMKKIGTGFVCQLQKCPNPKLKKRNRYYLLLVLIDWYKGGDVQSAKKMVLAWE